MESGAQENRIVYNPYPSNACLYLTHRPFPERTVGDILWMPTPQVQGVLLDVSTQHWQDDGRPRSSLQFVFQTSDRGDSIVVDTGLHLLGETDANPASEWFLSFAREFIRDRRKVLLSISECGKLITLEDRETRQSVFVAYRFPGVPMPFLDAVVDLRGRPTQTVRGRLVALYHDSSDVELLDPQGKLLYVFGFENTCCLGAHDDWRSLIGREVTVASRCCGLHVYQENIPLDPSLLDFLSQRQKIVQSGSLGDSRYSAETFVETFAKRNPLQAKHWANLLRHHYVLYANASGYPHAIVLQIASQLRRAARSMSRPGLYTWVRFEPFFPSFGLPFSGRIEEIRKTENGLQYRLRAMTGDRAGEETLVYGLLGSFCHIDTHEAIGFDSGATPEMASS